MNKTEFNLRNKLCRRKTTKLNISSFITLNRRVISSATRTKNNNVPVVTGKIELDSHADTIVAGANCCVLHFTGRECDVSPYSSEYKPVQGVPIVSAATAWQSPNTGQLYVLVLNEALYMPQLPNSHDPNQLWHYGM